MPMHDVSNDTPTSIVYAFLGRKINCFYKIHLFWRIEIVEEVVHRLPTSAYQGGDPLVTHVEFCCAVPLGRQATDAVLISIYDRLVVRVGHCVDQIGNTTHDWQIGDGHWRLGIGLVFTEGRSIGNWQRLIDQHAQGKNAIIRPHHIDNVRTLGNEEADREVGIETTINNRMAGDVTAVI